MKKIIWIILFVLVSSSAYALNYTESHNKTMATTGSQDQMRCLTITIKENRILRSVTRHADATNLNTAYLYNEDGTDNIANASKVGELFYFQTQPTLSALTNYTICGDNNGSSYLSVYSGEEAGFVESLYLNFTEGAQINTGTWSKSSRYFNFINITTSETEAAATPPIAPTFDYPTPDDNAINNTNQTINITHPGTDIRYWLYVNDLIYIWNETETGSGYKTFLTNFSDGDYTYKASVQNITNGLFSTNISRTLEIDTINPTITFTGNNTWKTDNSTIISGYISDIGINVSFFDINLYRTLINISNSSGHTKYSKLNSSLSGATTANYTLNMDLSTWEVGNYTMRFLATDSHTLNSIQEYDVDSGFDYFRYKTTEGNVIKIESDSLSLTKKTTKLEDRYTFEFGYLTSKETFKFMISSYNKIDYLPDSGFPAHFVIMSSDGKGNWLDFGGINKGDISVTKIDEYTYEVEITSNGKSSFKFNSLGGLNLNEKHYQLRVGAVVDTWVFEELNNTEINATVTIGSQSANTTADSSAATLVNITKEEKQIIISSPGYAQQTNNLSVTSNYHNLTYNLTTVKAVKIYFYDESTHDLILNQSFNIYMDNGTSSSEHTSSSNPYTITGLSTGSYELRVSSTVYDPRWYSNIPILDNQTTSIDVYLLNSTISSETTFSIVDRDTAASLADVLILMYKQINGSWTTIESKYSDVTGELKIYYQENIKYYFNLSKNGYLDNTFFLNPILFDEYTLKMSPSVVINVSQDYDRLLIYYTPKIFYDGHDNNFSFLIESPHAALTDYGYELTYPGGSSSESGLTPAGSWLNTTISITGAGNFSRVRFDYYYDTALSGRRDFTYYYGIVPLASNNTIVSAGKDPTYGLGLFERLLIVTIICIFIAGIATMAGQPLAGAALALLIFGFFAYIQFIPWASILISLIIGMLMLASKSGG